VTFRHSDRIYGCLSVCTDLRQAEGGRGGSSPNGLSLDKTLHGAQQRRQLPPFGAGSCGVTAVPQGAVIALGCAGWPCHRASGIARSSSRAIGTASRPASGQGSAGERAAEETVLDRLSAYFRVPRPVVVSN
jgi:hypothetical protein